MSTNKTSDTTFNLSQHIQKQSSMAYEGGRGYFLAQTRAWMNCIKCHQESKKSAQASWQACFDEFQKGDGKLSWIRDHVGEVVASKVKKEAAIDYKGDVQKRVAGGASISLAVAEALQAIDGK